MSDEPTYTLAEAKAELGRMLRAADGRPGGQPRAEVPFPGRGSAHDEGLRVARRWARWHLGSAHWADLIIGVYMHPQEAERNLVDEIDRAP